MTFCEECKHLPNCELAKHEEVDTCKKGEKQGGESMAKWLKAIGGNLCDNPDNTGFFVCSNCGVIHKGNKDKICPKCNSKMEVEQTRYN